MVAGGSWLRPTRCCSALLCLREEQVSWTLGTEGQEQELCEGWDEGQGEHQRPVALCSQHRFLTGYLQQTHLL